MKNQYVILTGSKNNAGDFLIKHRTKKLFEWLKPESSIVDFNGWERLTDEKLDLINKSKALIMTGGPALQRGMYPKVYGLREKLDDIKVPMLTMGIGWYSKRGEWRDTHHYQLDAQSMALLDRIDNSGYKSSVRDYHTLNVLHTLGMKNFLMTGCPALYSKEHINSEFMGISRIKKIALSLGASLKYSDRMFKQMQDLLLMMQELFPRAEVQVVFHHSPTDIYLRTHGANSQFYVRQKQYLSWLEQNNFDYVDISGNADNLISYYSNIDFHIGYRVHAHIFMSSISKPSVLLSEDGRGKALEKVIGGVVFDAYDSTNNSLLFKILHKLSIKTDSFNDNKHLLDDLSWMFSYEMSQGIKFSQPRVEIDRHIATMHQFIKQLPS